VEDLVAQVAAIAQGDESETGNGGSATDELREAAARARRVPPGFEQAAALEFLGDAIAAGAVDHRLGLGEAREIVAAAGRELGVPADTAAFVVFRRALTSKECIQLPPAVATDLALSLLVELAPAAAASLWVIGPAGATSCLVAHGKAPRSRAIREAARAALDGVIPSGGPVRVQLVERWDRPYAALVVRARKGGVEPLEAYLAEMAAALAPLFERSETVDRRLDNERHLVAAGERRLIRLGADLHDGPLQELVLLAEELRLASEQIETLVATEDRSRVHGRFDDLHARLQSLDEGLRAIAHATRSAAAAAPPVEDSLKSELGQLERASSIETDLQIEGDLSDLTDSQKIVLFRVTQEALSNVRRHSRARKVSLVLRSTRTVLDLAISDDGCGFDARNIGPDRLGLAGISERVRLLGGIVEIESGVGSGVTVRAILPQWRPSNRAIPAMSSPD
jgi:signal transduction histidine kinase